MKISRTSNIAKVALSAALLLFISMTIFPTVAAGSSKSSKVATSTVGKKTKGKKEKVKNTFDNPDFAFPETVDANARPQWENALRNKDGVKALKAGLQIIVARNLISRDNFNSNIAMLDSAAKVMEAPYSSLFKLLLADLYTQLYNQSRWTYNQRTLPTDTFPDDPRSWSEALFAKKVYELTKAANENGEAAKSLLLSNISSVLTSAEQMEKAGCSVYDFIALKSMSMLRVFERDNDNVLPFSGRKLEKPTSPSGCCRVLSGSIMKDVLSYHEKLGNDNSMALMADACSQFLNEKEKLPFLWKWKDFLINSPADARLIDSYFQYLIYEYPYMEDVEDEDDESIENKEAKEKAAFYHQMKEWVARFPDAEGVDAVKSCIAYFERKQISVEYQHKVLPDREINVEVKMENATSAYLLVYSLTTDVYSGGVFDFKTFPSKAKLLETIPVEIEGSVPFVKKKKLSLPGLPPGGYLIVPSVENSLPSDWKSIIKRGSIHPLHVTDLALIMTNDSQNPDSGRLYVVKGEDESPVEGAKVRIYDNRNKLIKSLVTDSMGAVEYPTGYHNIIAEYGKSKAESQFGFNTYRSEFKATRECNILTDLSIYRPGDEVEFVLVEWMREKSRNRILANEEIKVVMRDANNNAVDTLQLTTDSYGRASGKFTIPKSGLLGNYCLVAFNGQDGKNSQYGNRFFEVAEYKTPGFLVELEKGKSNCFNAGDSIRFSGKVQTYSGMPLEGANVEYKITWSPWWRWGGDDSSASYSGETETSAEGTFSIDLLTSALKDTKYSQGIFTMNLTATSPSGETQQAPALRFSLGNDFMVRPMIPEKMCIESDTVRLKVPVYDILNLPAIKNVEYQIARLNYDGKNREGEYEVVKRGVFESPVLEIPSEELPSGKYKLSFNVEGDSVKNSRYLLVYRNSDTRPYFPAVLWLPTTSYIAPEGAENVDVTVGSGYSHSSVLAILSDGTGIVSREWISIDNENKKVSVPAPKEGEKVWLTLSGMRDFRQVVSTVTIEPQSASRKLEVSTTVLRNKLTAGDKERWKFKFTVDGEPVKEIPAFAVMTDKALDAIAPFRWNFSPSTYYLYNSVYISQRGNFNETFSIDFSKWRRKDYFPSVYPTWNTYSQGLGLNGVMNLRKSARLYGSRSVSNDGVQYAVMVEGAADEMEMAVEEVAPTAKMALKEESVLAEKQYEESSADTGGGENGSATAEKIRPMEMPLAFFKPNLNGDKKGEVEVEFEVPNFNTTWQFQIYGYTRDLLTANEVLEAVASKKVMVQTNAPRFLRTGDRAEISALIFNNSENTEKLDGEIILFNPITGETIYSFHQGAETVAPSGNRKISINFTVPTDISAIGIRTIGSSKKFSDGEETVVPVLPSSTPLIESTQFYLGRERNSFTVRLPKYPADANLTLRYCSNPVWECILALPSISKPDSKNVLTLMHALYANVTVDGILARFPEVKDGLAKIFSDKEGNKGVLTSNLEKDEELKSVALENTPWVNNASSETQRLSSLSELLEEGKASKASEELLKEVKGLQNSDGGWSWCSGMQSSEYISRSVLAGFAMMKKNGNLSSEATSMVNKGISYCDKKIYDDYVKSKHQFSTYDLLDYLYVRSNLDNGNGSTGFSMLKSKALKAISEEWKGFGISEKAVAAMVMARSKGYERYAGVILESLRQYAVKDENRGWQFANIEEGQFYRDRLKATTLVLEAFAEIEPKAEAVDGLRQWLVLQKETEDWGVDSNTVEVIQAILDSGTDWTTASSQPEIKIGGKVLKIADTEQPAGLATVTLDARKVAGKELRITKTSDVPSWGAVLSQSVAPIVDVKSARCENLKIEKQILKIERDGNGEKVIDGKLKVGDKVRVTLTVTCDKDMDYVAIVDERAACLAPDEQLSGYIFNDGRGMYREIRDTRTSLFLYHLPKGVNVFSFDCHVDKGGEYANGIATVQSMYSPQQVAHSGGLELKVE